MNLPDEILIRILENLDVGQLTSFCASYPQIHQICQTPAPWLASLSRRFNTSLSTEQAFIMLSELFEAHIIGKIRVTLLGDNKVTILGEILLSPAYSLLSIVLEIRKRFLVMGKTKIRQVIDSEDFTSDRYSKFDISYPDYSTCGFNDVILPGKFSPLVEDETHIDKLSTVLSRNFVQTIPQPFPDDMEIVIYKRQYTDRELNIIDESLTEAKDLLTWYKHTTRQYMEKRYTRW